MQQYEFLVKSVSDDCDLDTDKQFLKEQGAQGWRLVSVVKTATRIIYYMERPLTSSFPYNAI